MAKYKNIDTDENLESILEYGTPEFPLLVFDDDFDYYQEGCINWHWHSHIEFAIALKGKFNYHVGNRIQILYPGEALFINANQIRMGEPARDKGDREKPEMFSVAFAVSLLAASGRSIIYDKYILPIISNPAIDYVHLSPKIEWQKKIITNLKHVFVLDKERPYGYELQTQILLSDVWMQLVLNFDSRHLTVNESFMHAQSRLQQMIVYIGKAYMNPISINDIAKAANISKSSCYRCFQECLKVTPLEYLKEYRLEKAMQLLRKKEHMLVSDVANCCGFGSTSYFIQCFKNKMDVTPLEYRKSHLRFKRATY